MTLYSCDKIPAIAPISENCFLTEAQYAKLKSKFNKIILFYDNDLAGIENMNKIRKKFPDVHVLFIPRHYKAKDISDFYKMYGRTKTLELIEKQKLRLRKGKQEHIVEIKDIDMRQKLLKNLEILDLQM